MIAGDLALRRLPVAAALDNAAPLATGAALAGLAYARLGGATGAQALTASNLVPLVAFLVLLPCVVNGTFYIELALGRTLAWVDAALTARWEAVVYACSVGLALACLALAHASIDMIGFLVIGVVLVSAAVGRVQGGAGLLLPGRWSGPVGTRPARRRWSRCITPGSWWAFGVYVTRIPACTTTPTPTCWRCWHRSSP